jgi:hypothetical protein
VPRHQQGLTPPGGDSSVGAVARKRTLEWRDVRRSGVGRSLIGTANLVAGWCLRWNVNVDDNVAVFHFFLVGEENSYRDRVS